MESLGFEHDFFVSVIALNFPAPEIEVDDLLFHKLISVVEIGQEDGKSSVRVLDLDDSERDGLKFLFLPGGYLAEVVAARGYKDDVFFLAIPDEFFHSREGVRGRAANDEIAVESVLEMGDELIARVASIEEKNTPGRNTGNQGLSLGALGGINVDDTSGYWNAPEDIISS